MDAQHGWLATELERRGVSRREFMGFCATMAAALSLPDAAAAQIARAVQRTDKPVLIWLEFQDCAGNTESFLRASRPTAAEVILDMLSVDYHETIMAAAGMQAEQNRDNTVKQRAGAYIAIVEGSIPTGPTAPTARSAGAPHSTSPARSAAMPPPQSRSGRARLSAVSLRLRRIQRARWEWLMRYPG